MELGEPFTISWRVIGHRNQNIAYWFPLEVEVFCHQFEDTGDVTLMVTQDWLDTSDHAEYARAYIDGTHVDPDDPFSHERIDRPEEVDRDRR